MRIVPDQVTLVDLYHQYASGQLDSSTEVSAELVTSHMSEVTTCDNRSKIKFKIPPAALTMVSGADENLVIYFMWPYLEIWNFPHLLAVANKESQSLLILHV